MKKNGGGPLLEVKESGRILGAVPQLVAKSIVNNAILLLQKRQQQQDLSPSPHPPRSRVSGHSHSKDKKTAPQPKSIPKPHKKLPSRASSNSYFIHPEFLQSPRTKKRSTNRPRQGQGQGQTTKNSASKKPNPLKKKDPKPAPSSMMGWGQLGGNTAAKRGRHCSDENRNTNHAHAPSSSSSSSAGLRSSESDNCCTETEEEDGKASHQFGKRPRDVSPLNNMTPGSGDATSFRYDDEVDSDGLPDPNRLRISGGDGDEGPGCSRALLPKKSPSLMPPPPPEETFYDLGDLKIRTSTPKPLRKGGQKGVVRGPRVSAARPRSALPSRRIGSSPKKSRPPTTTTVASTSSSDTSSTATATSATSSSGTEEDGYVDVDDSEESSSGEYEETSEATSSTSSPTSARSVDEIPAEVSSPQILPPLRPSYFPNVPPYINFCLHNQRTEPLPREIGKHLKWRLSNITPVVVKKTLANSGYRLLRKTVEWNGHWGRHMKAALFKTSIKDFQKLNHLPGTFQIGRKDRLWRNIQRFMNKFGKEEWGFMPKTFVLPLETKQLRGAWDMASKNQLWIVKPPALARGTGIRVVNRWNQVPKKKPMIVQSYIGNPYLINDRKFDLRIYVLVTNFHPLKVYIYNDGLVRFAPVKYSNDTKRAGDRFMHLTNYSINKNCELYTTNEDADASEGHKWTLKTLWRHFLEKGKDVEKLWSQIEEIVIKTLICAEDPIVTSTTCYLPNLYNGYELFGYDIILDADLKPWLLEVNISPSLHSSSPLDLAVKGPMIKELLNIAGYHLPPKLSPVVKSMLSRSLDVNLELETPVFDKRIYANNSLSREEQNKHKFFKTKFEKRTEYLDEIIETLTPDDVRQLITAEDELSQCYNFYRIYPTPSTHTYTPYFELPRYYNMLFDAWENKYHEDRPAAVARLQALCRQKIHLQVPVNAGSMISESPVASEAKLDKDKIPLQGDHKLSTNGNIVEDLIQETTATPTPIYTLISGGNPDEKVSSPSPPLPVVAAPSAAVIPPSKLSPTPSAVLDNITNSCSRSIGSNCPCHPASSSNGKPQNNSSIPSSTPNVADLPKGICF